MQLKDDLSLETALEQFLAHCKVEKGLSHNTISAYSSDLRLFFAFLGQERPLRVKDVKREHIVAFAKYRSEENIGAKSLHRGICALRRFFLFARKEGIITFSPASDIDLPRVPKRLPKAIHVKDIDEMLKGPHSDRARGLRDGAIIAVLYGCGLRVTELVTLKISDLDLMRGYVKTLGKGQKERVVPLNERALALTAAYLEQGRPALLGESSSALVFIRKGGHGLSRQSAWKIIKKIRFISRHRGSLAP